MFRASLNLFRLWGVKRRGGGHHPRPSTPNVRALKAGRIGRIGRDGKARLSNLIGIHKASKSSSARRRADTPGSKRRTMVFGGDSALTVMLGSELTDLMRVRRYTRRRTRRLVIDARASRLHRSTGRAHDASSAACFRRSTCSRTSRPGGLAVTYCGRAEDQSPVDGDLGCARSRPAVAARGGFGGVIPHGAVHPCQPSLARAGSRRGDYGVLYAAERFETALFETMHHHGRFMARTAEPQGWTSQFRELILDLAADLHDLRGGDPAWQPALNPDDYVQAQALVVALRAQASDGLVYPSQRDPGGECAGLFYPDRAANVAQGRHLDYHWNGEKVDLYRDAGSGEVFRVELTPKRASTRGYGAGGRNRTDTLSPEPDLSPARLPVPPRPQRSIGRFPWHGRASARKSPGRPPPLRPIVLPTRLSVVSRPCLGAEATARDRK